MHRLGNSLTLFYSNRKYNILLFGKYSKESVRPDIRNLMLNLGLAPSGGQMATTNKDFLN